MNSALAKKNKINTLLNRYFNLGVIVLAIFLLLLAYILVLRPKADEVVLSAQETIYSQQRLLQAEQARLDRLTAAVEAYSQINPVDIERVNNILPSDYDKEALFGEVEELINNQGFILTSLVIKKDTDKVEDASVTEEEAPLLPEISENIGTIYLQLEVAAIDYAGLKNLLISLEKNLKFLEVANVSLSGDDTASLTLVTYYYK
ncbi:MAG: hypothetical protein JST_000182 [Candidatus Parcubacteria bacterium]|jgi:hypothetical protein|nr:MAG: hypothetical protein JST_1640 [Candidatus Parcubacteria bacterium]